MQKVMKKNTFMEGVFILMFSQGLTKILGLIYTLYLVNREGFGDSGNAIYGSGYQIYAMLLTLSSIGVPNAISKMISEKVAVGDFKGSYKIFKVALGTFGVIGFLGTLILMIGSDYISKYLLQIPEAKIILITLSPAIFFVAVASVLKGFFNGLENMEATAKSQIIEQICKTIFTIIIVEAIACLSKNSTVYMAAGATIATTLATLFGFCYLIYYFILCKKKIGSFVKYSVKKKNERILTIAKRILKVSVPISLSAIMASLTKNIDSMTVVRELKKYISISEAKVQYGILSGKIETLVTLPLSLNMAFTTSLVPTISSAKAVGNKQIIKQKISFSILIGILIALPCTVGINLFSKQILNLLFPNANQGVEILKISSLSILFSIISQTISGVMQGLGEENSPAKAYGIGIIVKILGNIILLKIPALGVKGAAISTVMCNFTSAIILYIKLNKLINIKLRISKLIVKPVICATIMAICSKYIFNLANRILMEKMATIIALISAALIYIIFIILLKIFSKKEISKIIPNNRNKNRKSTDISEKYENNKNIKNKAKTLNLL